MCSKMWLFVFGRATESLFNMYLKYPMLPLLLTWVIATKTEAQMEFDKVPDYRRSHSALLNIHHPGGSKIHSYHRRGPFGNGVLYVHRQGRPASSPLIIHRTASSYGQQSKLGQQILRAVEDTGMAANSSADASVPSQSASSGRVAAISSALLAPTGYFNSEEMNSHGISEPMPMETIVYPLAKTIQKHYIPRRQPFLVRLWPEHLRHIPVGMVVTPPRTPQYFRASNWNPSKDESPVEERMPSLPTPRPSLPSRPSSPPPDVPLPPLNFPVSNYYTYVPEENPTGDYQPPILALHPPQHFPSSNCYVPASKNEEQTSSSSRSSENLPSDYFPNYNFTSYDPSKLQAQQSNATTGKNTDSSAQISETIPYYLPKSGYLPYDPLKLQSRATSEARTLPHHHISYHEAASHSPHLIHGGYGEGLHEHIMVHHSKPVPYIHSDFAPELNDDILVAHGGHSTYLHEEPSLHGHLSLHLGRSADVPNMPLTYDDGFHQPKLLSNNYSPSYHPSTVTSFVPYEYYGYPSPVGYSRIPHIASQSIPNYNRNTPNDEPQNKQDVPYLLRHLRSFEGSEHKSRSIPDNSASEPEESLTISLPVNMLDIENETASPTQKRELISGGDPDFHFETTKMVDLSHVLNRNAEERMSMLEKILSIDSSNEKDNTHSTAPAVDGDGTIALHKFSERSASHPTELGEEVQAKEFHQKPQFAELKDASLQSDDYEPEQTIAPLHVFWERLRAKRSKRQTSQKPSSNANPDNTATARSQDEDSTIGYVIGFLDPEAYNYYYGSENKNYAGMQDYDYRQIVNEKISHGVQIPVYYKERKTDSYLPVNLMSYKETATSKPRSVQEETAIPNITTKNVDSYWSYNKTARYNNYGADSFSDSSDLYNPEPVPIPYQQPVEHLMPHRFLNTYPTKMPHSKAYPMYSYSNDNPITYQQPNGYYADMPRYPAEQQMDARSFSEMGLASEHPIRHHHHPIRYNTQGNMALHGANAHPIRHHPRPGRYYPHISQQLVMDSTPYHSINGANAYPVHHSRYYPHARSFHNVDDIEVSPVRDHYTRRYYKHSSGYLPQADDYNDERYHSSRYFDPVPARPYGYTDELIGPQYLDRYSEYAYPPNRDITSYGSIHPSRYHHRYHERIHGHSYQPGYHVERLHQHPSRYHHSHRYYEHVHGREATTPDSNISATSQHPQMRSDDVNAVDDNEQTDGYPQKKQSDVNVAATPRHLPGTISPNMYYGSNDPKSQIALVSFFTTDKQSPYPIRFHRLDPYAPMYYPSQYMSPIRQHEYNNAGYFSKMEA